MSEIIMKKKKAKAFTLIELIIVLAIMAIIAAIAIPNFMAVRDSSKAKADTQSKATIQRTVLMLVSDGTIGAGAKTATLDFNADGSIKGLKGSTFDGASTDVTVAAATNTNLALLNALKDTKAPQVSTETFIIIIDSSGNVTVN